MKIKSAVPKVVTCKDFHDYLQRTNNERRRAWAYRGHTNRSGSYKIESSLQRFLKDHAFIQRNWWVARERSSIGRFRAGAHLHLQHLPDDQDTLSWLALMQHYGSPTRLIDFTLSPAVGFFFAIHGAKPGDAYSVHALHVNTIRAECYAQIKKRKGKAGPGDYYVPVSADYRIGEGKPEDFVGIFASKLNSARQQAQEGLFLVPSNLAMDVEDWLHRCTPDKVPCHWIEYRFDASEDSYRCNVEQFLKIALSPVGLFPGLEGLAQSARYSWFDLSRDYQPLEMV